MAIERRTAVYPSLEDRVVVVTGGASGIGAAVVEAFARQGSRVVFLDVQDEVAEALIERMSRDGLRVPTYARCDLTDIAALRAAVREVERRFGGVDVLVNNAGNDTRHSVESVTEGMRGARRGSIINMGSIAWVIPSTNLPVYVTAKAGIVGMTRTLAHEFGMDDVRVNCVMPGAVLTERQQKMWFTPEYKAEILANQALKRMILPEEVASVVLFLAADESSAITSQSFVVDGGWV
ncbi:MAG: SDR family NAD(P)-dependent oxidoreductase [Acidobacteriota bacterium]